MIILEIQFENVFASSVCLANCCGLFFLPYCSGHPPINLESKKLFACVKGKRKVHILNCKRNAKILNRNSFVKTNWELNQQWRGAVLIENKWMWVDIRLLYQHVFENEKYCHAWVIYCKCLSSCSHTGRFIINNRKPFKSIVFSKLSDFILSYFTLLLYQIYI